jgi:peptidoglycan hydrolase-like protein with peptidoglycan-binding domain
MNFAKVIVCCAFVAVACASSCSDQVLRSGSRGECVKVVQRAVGGWNVTYKYSSCSGVTVDGIFGPNTDRAVRAFQTNNQLTNDGIVGKRTWAAIGRSGGSSSG